MLIDCGQEYRANDCQKVRPAYLYWQLTPCLPVIVVMCLIPPVKYAVAAYAGVEVIKIAINNIYFILFIPLC